MTPEPGAAGDDSLPASPFMRAARSQRKRPAFPAQRFLKYDPGAALFCCLYPYQLRVSTLLFLRVTVW